MAAKTHQYRIQYEDSQYVMTTSNERDRLAAVHWSRGQFDELPMLRWVETLAHSGDYVEVGANMGNSSVFFLTRCQCTHLYAFEPVSDIYQLLRRNVEANNTHKIPVTLIQSAVYQFGGMQAVWPALDYLDYGRTRMQIRERSLQDTYPQQHKNTAMTRKLDQTIPKHANVALLRIAAGGHELPVLYGAVELLQRSLPVVIADVKKPRLLRDIDAFLQQLGYTRYPTTPQPGIYLWATGLT
jgi:FkbM family methyltransferase